MRAIGFVLRVLGATSVLAAVFVISGALDQFGRPQAEEPVHSDLPLASSESKPAPVLEPQPVTPPAADMGSAQTTTLPAPSSEGIAAPNETSWPQATTLDRPAPTQQDMLHLAAAAPQIPGLRLAHIPPLVIKFAPAKILFGAMGAPTNMASRSLGFYSRGCLAGGKPLPVDGPAWQAMRLSRNRIWGHPSLVRYIERFAKDAKEKDGWPGLLVGDMSMPRGGPMPFGHASHQIGLDVDIWYKPMPDKPLTVQERETMPLESFLLDPAHVNPAVWTADYVKLLRRAVSYPEVTRVFVNPAIKKWLCDNVKEDRTFLRKIHPIIGHDDHFHVRLTCPPDNPSCRNQPAVSPDEGCDKGLDAWIARLSKEKPAEMVVVSSAPPLGHTPTRATRGKRSLTVAQLPIDCRKVLEAPSLSAAAR